ncbi:MAG TPA: hypothetical protein VK604_01300 [Bryobacteraceae bacterium]|nr:hypothetical protein [Bryobacteraceae bacterium]
MASVRFKPATRRRSGSQQSGTAGKTPLDNYNASSGSGATGLSVGIALVALVAGALAVYSALQIHDEYTFSLQSPVVLRLQWPVVIAHKLRTDGATRARLDQRRSLNAYQQYACQAFGSACREALAIQRAENPQGKCEIYHYNTDGTLDWGYFQINTVHLKRPGLNLRDLLDCKANIDFAVQLYMEHHGFTPWHTYNNGAYRKFLRN